MTVPWNFVHDCSKKAFLLYIDITCLVILVAVLFLYVKCVLFYLPFYFNLYFNPISPPVHLMCIALVRKGAQNNKLPKVTF